jgi:hypothetical protein
MKIELKDSGKQSRSGDAIYHLYINGETDGIEYYDRGEECGLCPWNVKERHMKRLMEIKCSDYPDEFTLWNTTSYEMCPGKIALFEINRTQEKMNFEIWFGLGNEGKYDEKSWPFNPFLLINKIYALSSGTFFKKRQKEFRFEECMDAMFTFHSDLEGTIGDKFNTAYEVLHDLVNEAEKQVFSEAKHYLKTRKIKF